MIQIPSLLVQLNSHMSSDPGEEAVLMPNGMRGCGYNKRAGESFFASPTANAHDLGIQ
jgi:hypothetical protein